MFRVLSVWFWKIVFNRKQKWSLKISKYFKSKWRWEWDTVMVCRVSVGKEWVGNVWHKTLKKTKYIFEKLREEGLYLGSFCTAHDILIFKFDFFLVGACWNLLWEKEHLYANVICLIYYSFPQWNYIWCLLISDHNHLCFLLHTSFQNQTLKTLTFWQKTNKQTQSIVKFQTSIIIQGFWRKPHLKRMVQFYQHINYSITFLNT